MSKIGQKRKMYKNVQKCMFETRKIDDFSRFQGFSIYSTLEIAIPEAKSVCSHVANVRNG